MTGKASDIKPRESEVTMIYSNHENMNEIVSRRLNQQVGRTNGVTSN